MSITRKDIDNYFALGKKIKEGVIHLSKVLSDNGFVKMIPRKILEAPYDINLIPPDMAWDDIKYLHAYENDDTHEVFEAVTPDDDGRNDYWDVPARLLVLNDRELLETIAKMKAAQRIIEEKERKARARRERIEAKRQRDVEYKYYLELKEKFAPPSKRKKK